MRKFTAEELSDIIEESEPVHREQTGEWRWGFFETQIHEVDGKHYAIPVTVTTGDEGGVEATGEPYEVEEREVTVKKWVGK